MRQSTAKATRRDLRRAMGESAIGTINGQAETLSQVVGAVNTLGVRVMDLDAEHQALARRVSALEGASTLVQQHVHLTSRWQRLKWVLSL